MPVGADAGPSPKCGVTTSPAWTTQTCEFTATAAEGKSTLRMPRRLGLTELAWVLAVLGAVTLMVGTLAPASAVASLLFTGCALVVLAVATYGVSRLQIRRGRRPGS